MRIVFLMAKEPLQCFIRGKDIDVGDLYCIGIEPRYCSQDQRDYWDLIEEPMHIYCYHVNMAGRKQTGTEADYEEEE